MKFLSSLSSPYDSSNPLTILIVLALAFFLLPSLSLSIMQLTVSVLHDRYPIKFTFELHYIRFGNCPIITLSYTAIHQLFFIHKYLIDYSFAENIMGGVTV